MAAPKEPKEAKPKTEGAEGAKPGIKIDENMKVIIINLLTTVLICVLFLSVNYVLQANLLNSKLDHKPNPEDVSAVDEEGAATGEGEEPAQRGVIVDLGDFILNLGDAAPRKYLKVNVALEVSTKPEDTAAAAEGGGHGGGHGEAAAPAASPVETEMLQFKPALRDAIITTLSSKTSAELSTVAGKELAKEQITEAVNGIFGGEREVLRVSFGQFIIQ